jgi:hypothetical protein
MYSKQHVSEIIYQRWFKNTLIGRLQEKSRLINSEEEGYDIFIESHQKSIIKAHAGMLEGRGHLLASSQWSESYKN